MRSHKDGLRRAKTRNAERLIDIFEAFEVQKSEKYVPYVSIVPFPTVTPKKKK